MKTYDSIYGVNHDGLGSGSMLKKLRNLKPGQFIQANGYYVKGDLGVPSTYLVKTTAQATADGDFYSASSRGNILNVDGDLVAVLQHRNSVDIHSVGLISDGSVQSAIFAEAQMLADNKKLALDLGSALFGLDEAAIFTLDVANTRLIGNGARVFFVPSGSQTLITFENSEVDVNKRGIIAASNSIDGVSFYGPGKNDAGNCRLAVINDSVNDSIWGITFQNGGMFGFPRCIDCINGAFMLNLKNFHGISNGVNFNFVSATNAGERFTAESCTFTNSNEILNQSNPNASSNFISCSLDYTPRMMTVLGGDVSIIGGHIESNLDTQNWFVITGSNSSVNITNAAIVLNNDEDDLSFAPFFVDPSVTMGGLNISNCDLWTNGTYTTDVLIDGDGTSKVRGLTYFENGKKPAIARSCSDLAYGDFESADFADDYLSLTGSTPPTRTAAKFYTGTHSLEFNQPNGTAACKAVISRPCKPGDLLTGHLYYETDVATQTATLLINVIYKNAAGNTLESYNRLSETTDVLTWTKLEFTPQRRAPKGSVTAELTIEVFGASGSPAQAWVDDVIVNVV